MKKIMSILVAVLVIAALACPAFAEGNFVPSITYKPSPDIVPVVDENGVEHIGVIRDAQGNILDYVDAECLEITSIAEVLENSENVSADVKALLEKLYNGLKSGEMKLPYEKHNDSLKSSDMVLRDLFDARWRCTEHAEMLVQEGVTLEITFKLGVDKNAEIYVMSYDEEANDWEPIVSAKNNGDGTVTCTFAHLCGIEFSVHNAGASTTGDTFDMMPWIVLMTVSAGAIVALLVAKKKVA